MVSSDSSAQAQRQRSWRDTPRIERVAALVFFSAVWVLWLAMGSGSRADAMVNVVAGLALALASPMALSNSPRVWRIFKWPATASIAAVFVLLAVAT